MIQVSKCIADSILSSYQSSELLTMINCHQSNMKSAFMLVCTFHVVNSFKIIVYSAPMGFSHMQFMGRIADILTEAGHDVTVLHPIWEPKYLHAVSTSAKQVLVDLPLDLKEEFLPGKMNVWEPDSQSILQQLQMFDNHTKRQLSSCDVVLRDNATMDRLINERFDAGIAEVIESCAFGIFHKLGLNHIIGASAVSMPDTVGDYFDVPRLPSVVPSFLGESSDKMTFYERTINFVLNLFADVVVYRIIAKYEKLWHCHNISVKEDDYVNKMNYLLLNSDEFLEFARPISAKVVHIGGIALPEPSPLPEELQKIMDQSYRSGVVYISFGSIASTIEMPRHFRRAIFSVARAFPMYSFIWKVDGDDAIESVSNLYTFTWVPQRSLLAHRNLLCFVSHAGLNSVLELTTSGKPAILVPLFADQFRNARMVEAKNTAILIKKEEFNTETFASALRRMLSHDNFTRRAERLASLVNNKPFPVRERLLSTVDFSIRHGKIDNLDIYGRNLNALQYYSIDSAVFLITIIGFIVFGSTYSCLYCFRKIF
ncbi:hypothetical protein Angca_008688, partial [Angiostrongylus cantonensis]